LRQPNRLGALLPFDSGENAINPNAGILKISKQISDRYPFTINADQTEIHFTLNQNKTSVINSTLGAITGLGVTLGEQMDRSCGLAIQLTRKLYADSVLVLTAT
jgi:hypothetical protein